MTDLNVSQICLCFSGYKYVYVFNDLELFSTVGLLTWDHVYQPETESMSSDVVTTCFCFACYLL